MHRDKEQAYEREKRPKDSHKKEKKEKKQKKKHRKHHSSSSDQRGDSRSKSRSRSRSHSQPKEKKHKESQIEKPAESRPQSFPIRRGRVNSHLLTHIISDHKKINRKLDNEQVQRAATKFKQNFTEEISPVTMSAFLSNQVLRRQVQAKQLTCDYQCRICGETFQNGCDFNEHIQNFHRSNK